MLLRSLVDVLVLTFPTALLIHSLWPVHMDLPSIEMGAGNGPLLLVCRHPLDINMLLYVFVSFLLLTAYFHMDTVFINYVLIL